MASGGLTQRRRNFASDDQDPASPRRNNNGDDNEEDYSSRNRKFGNDNDNSKNIDGRDDFDDDDDADGDGKSGGGKSNRLTLMEQVLLMGLKDSQGYLSFWNDNISYVLRGCILMELSFRNRIKTVLEPRKRPYAERLVEVVSEQPTGEVLLDEALKLIKLERQSVGNWIDLMSGETWNLMKIGYQLKQVRERIAKGLVDKGVLRTEKRNFVLFDMATHPVADHSIKEAMMARATDVLLGRGVSATQPDRRIVALVCAAYAANVLDFALVNLSTSQRDAAFAKVDEFLQEGAVLTDRAKSWGITEIMAGVLSVYTKMDSIL
ncbi:hypothetical protein SeLEV6574_g06391 [Synchytrium endobioticum]|uniref:Golgi phosphoprotein 3 n=1 Tax=Synchytrium endobioticum TaxID=286115 RepID=A0A507CNY2_9FUNG|nr:hypothetical protein SeLEV6574_g06391 [Synchytrium endobioticum]